MELGVEVDVELFVIDAALTRDDFFEPLHLILKVGLRIEQVLGVLELEATAPEAALF
jgi:hypothetical protein